MTALYLLALIVMAPLVMAGCKEPELRYVEFMRCSHWTAQLACMHEGPCKDHRVYLNGEGLK